MDVKDGLCKVCNTGAFEDEQHLMFYCSAYHSLGILLSRRCGSRAKTFQFYHKMSNSFS